MGYVVKDAVERLRREIGVYRWDDWRRCCRNLGLRVLTVCPTDLDQPALLVGRVIIVRDNLKPEDTARLIYHEVAHYVLHAGDSATWYALPQGYVTLRKFERQAWEFADTFPVWD